MWRLPIEFSKVRFDVEPGQYVMPGYWSNNDIESLAFVLAQVLPDIPFSVTIPATSVTCGSFQSHEFEPAKLVIVQGATGEESPEWYDILAQLQPNYLFIQRVTLIEPDDLEWSRRAKIPLLETLRDQLSDQRHPLAPWNVKALDLDLAATLSPDIVDLAWLVDTTLSHRLDNASLGISRTAYLRSLLLACGQRLADRLSQLPLDEVGPALEVLLAEERYPVSAKRGRGGAAALRRVGLWSVHEGEARLERLAHAIDQPAVWGQLAHRLPVAAWTPFARKLLSQRRVEMSPEFSGTALDMEPLTRPPTCRAVEPERLRIRVVKTVNELEVGLAAIDLLLEIIALGADGTESSSDISQRRDTLIARLDALSTMSAPIGRGLLKLLKQALRFWSALDPSRRTDRETALAAMEKLNRIEHFAGIEAEIMGAARLTHADLILSGNASDNDLKIAENLATLERNRTAEGALTRPQIELILGYVAQQRNNLIEAERWMRTALSSYERNGDRPETAWVCHEIGKLLLDSGDADRAYEVILRAFRINEEAEDYESMAVTCQSLGKAAFHKRDFNNSVKWLERALKLFQESNNLRSISRCYRQMGLVYKQQRKFHKSKEYYEQALDIDTQLSDPASQASSQHHLGNLHYLKGDLEEAQQWYLKALENFEQIGDRTGAASSFHQLGLVAQSRGNSDEASNFYRQALEIFREQESPMGMAAVLHQLGMVARAQQRFDLALNYFQKSLELKKERGDGPGIASSMSQIGVLHTECDRAAEGLRWNLRSLALRREIGSTGLGHDLYWIMKQRDNVGPERFEMLLAQYLDDKVQIKEIMTLLENTKPTADSPRPSMASLTLETPSGSEDTSRRE